MRDVSILSLDRLRQVDGFREPLQRLDLFRGDLRNIHRRGFLKLDDRNARGDELRQRCRDVLEADGLMADVEHHAEMPAQGPNRGIHGNAGEFCEPRRRFAGIEVGREVVDRFVRRLEKTPGSGSSPSVIK